MYGLGQVILTRKWFLYFEYEGKYAAFAVDNPVDAINFLLEIPPSILVPNDAIRTPEEPTGIAGATLVVTDGTSAFTSVLDTGGNRFNTKPAVDLETVVEMMFSTNEERVFQ